MTLPNLLKHIITECPPEISACVACNKTCTREQEATCERRLAEQRAILEETNAN